MRKVKMVPRDKSQEDNLGVVVLAIIGLLVVLSLGLPLWLDVVAVVVFLYLGGRA